MGFDVEGARKAGYSDGEIADFLGDEQKFDVQGARKAGYNDTEILGELLTTVGRVPLPEGVKPSNAGGGRGSINPPTPQPGIVDRAVAGIKSLLAPSDPGLNTQNGDGSIFDKPAPPELQDQPISPSNAAAMSRAPWQVPKDIEAARVKRAALNAPEARAPDAQTVTGLQIAEAVRNPAARGLIAGALSVGQAGIGIARGAADAVGADGVSDALGSASRGGARVTGAITQGLQGTDKLVGDIAQSIASNIPTLVVGVAGGPAMTALFTQSAASEYNTGRNSGFSGAESAARAGIMASAEVLGERFGFPEQIKLIRGLTKDVPTAELVRTVRDMLIKEVPGEQLTTALQFIADKVGPAAQNPNATLDDYLNQAGETLKVTLGQSAVMGGGPAAVSTLRRATQRADEATYAPIRSAEEVAKSKGFLRPGAMPEAAPAAPATPRVEEMPTTPISPEEIRQRAPAAPVAPAPVVSTPTPGADIGVAAVPQGALAARAEQALKDANVSPENGPAQVVAPSGQRPDSGAPGGVGDVRPATPGGGRVGDDPGGSVAPGAAAQPVASPSAPDLALKKSPIAKYREQAGEIERNAPPPADGTTRLWRGNRPGEVGKNPQFTNDLAGIALPFREAYKGDLSYVDVPTSDLAKYVQKGAVAENAEFIVPPDVAAKATVVGAKTKPVEDFLKIDPKKFAPRDPRDPGVEVSDAPVQKGKPKGFDKSTAEDVKLADPDKIVMPKPSTEGFPTRESAVQFLKDAGLNEKFHVGNPSEDGTVFVIPFPTAAKKPTLHDKRTLDMTEEWLKVAPDSKVRPPKLVMTKIDTIEKSMVASVAEVVHTAFGIRVNLVDNLAERGVNGIAIHGTNDKSKRFSHVFVDAKVPDFVQTIGHEATHVLEKTSPDLYARLQEVILASRSKVGHTGYLSERMPLYKGRKLRADGKENIAKTMNDEFTADVSGAMWRDPQFWQRVYELDSGSTFRKLMYQFMKALNKVLNVARAHRVDASKLVKDIDQVRETAAQVWAERAQRNAAAPKAAAKGGTVDDVKEQAVWHGTPHRGIDKFSTDNIGTGEGAQVYGWGLYFASKRAVAEWYRSKLTNGGPLRLRTPDGTEFDPAEFTRDSVEGMAWGRVEGRMGPRRTPVALADAIKQTILDARGNRSRGVNDRDMLKREDDIAGYLEANLSGRLEIVHPVGQLYEVEIPEDNEMMFWDKPLNEQPEVVQRHLKALKGDFPQDWLDEALDRMNADFDELTGQEFYKLMKRALRDDAIIPNPSSAAEQAVIDGLDDKAVSLLMLDDGIKGIKYLDGTSRADGDGTYNYVIFNGDDTQIKGVQYQAATRDELYSNLAQDKAEPYKPTIPALRKEHAALRALLDCLRG